MDATLFGISRVLAIFSLQTEQIEVRLEAILIVFDIIFKKKKEKKGPFKQENPTIESKLLK